MDRVYSEALNSIEKVIPLETLTLPPELAKTRYPFGLFELLCNNWTGQGSRKVYSMRIKLPVLTFDMLGMSIYPQPCFDMPIFIFDITQMKKKMVAYINFMPLSTDPDYLKKYIDPLKSVTDKYRHFPKKEMPEWMVPFQNDATIYSMPDSIYVDDIKNCSLAYLKVYLELFSKAEKITDAPRLESIKKAQDRYCQDIVEKDGSRKMIAKITGMKKANRVFREVLV
jgi:15,16-dihydrobiliverdin:ferredoxin oxidoreductase